VDKTASWTSSPRPSCKTTQQTQMSNEIEECQGGKKEGKKTQVKEMSRVCIFVTEK